MKICLNGLNEDIKRIVYRVEDVINIGINKDGEKVEVSVLDNDYENVIEISRGKVNSIKYKEKNHFFRALGLYVQLVEEGIDEFYKEEKVSIESVGFMIDVSRNAVYKVDEIKKILMKIALMGYNRFMMYTEDTYEVDEYEYFGYLRGKYSKEELREIDNFAYSLGIEVIPCIQTLAHLKQTLKWEYAKDIKDSEDILLVGEEKTYKFIEALISNVRDVFRSKNIHVGMDEAFNLGRGAYLNKNGYKHHYELMIEHLNRVTDIAKKHDFTPMMWDDMFFRAGTPDGDYYDENTIITDEIINSIPNEVGLVYWDYYNNDREKYRKLLEIRESFNNKIIFAGGVWRWLGYTPSYSKTFVTTNAALSQCKEKGINEVFATAWGDDGSEAPINSILLGLILFGEHGYCDEVENDWLNKRCKFLTGLDMEEFLVLEELDLIPTAEIPNNRSLNPSKYLMYQDILLGAFDKHIEDLDLQSHYSRLAKKYEEISKKPSEYKDMYKFYSKLSSYLEIKSDIGIRIRRLYLEKDRNGLQNIVNNVLPDLKKRLANFHNVFRELWYGECKGQGFEVIDIRIGGVKERIDSTIYRINSYLDDKTQCIEELDEKRLYFTENITDECKLITYNSYKFIATQNILSW